MLIRYINIDKRSKFLKKEDVVLRRWGGGGGVGYEYMVLSANDLIRSSVCSP